MTHTLLVEAAEAVATDRERYHRDREASKAARKNPVGAELQRLNREWGATVDKHMAKIAPQQKTYLARRAELLEQLAKHRAENPTPAKLSVGRQPMEFSDATKILLYRVAQEHGKTHARGFTGITNTKRLDAILAEGKALLEAQTPTLTVQEGSLDSGSSWSTGKGGEDW